MIGREHLHLSSGWSLFPSVLPHQLDGVGLDVRHTELSHLEHGAEDGALESTAAGHGLVSVEGGAGGLGEDLLNQLLDGRDTSAAPDNLNTENIL